MTDLRLMASQRGGSNRTSAYNEYFNTDGSKATPLFDSFGRCFRNQAGRQWSGVCISVTLRLVYRHLLRHPPVGHPQIQLRDIRYRASSSFAESPLRRPLESDRCRLIITRDGIVCVTDEKKRDSLKATETPCNELRRPERQQFRNATNQVWAHRSVSAQTLISDMRLYCFADRSSTNFRLNLDATEQASRCAYNSVRLPLQVYVIAESVTLVARDARSRIIIVPDRKVFLHVNAVTMREELNFRWWNFSLEWKILARSMVSGGSVNNVKVWSRELVERLARLSW